LAKAYNDSLIVTSLLHHSCDVLSPPR